MYLYRTHVNYGASFTVGKTFYLHKPIGEILRFGIDATWVHLNYTNYKVKHITYWGTDNYQYDQIEVAMHVGPSITVKPADKLYIHGYFRYAPSVSVLSAYETLYGNYATFFVGGASISYGVIGLGMECRFGDCKCNEFGDSTEDGAESSSVNKTKYNGWKAYLTFRF